MILLGKGRLTWGRYERVSDRYGGVALMSDGDSLTPPTDDKYEQFVDAPFGAHGTLMAVVLETRESTHIGDISRGLAPSTPEVGDRFVLGTGTLQRDNGVMWDQEIVLVPDDGRKDNWLDARSRSRPFCRCARTRFPDFATCSRRTRRARCRLTSSCTPAWAAETGTTPTSALAESASAGRARRSSWRRWRAASLGTTTATTARTAPSRFG